MGIPSSETGSKPLNCNGRLCNFCGLPICRPYDRSMVGLHNQVVCDDCWKLAEGWRVVEKIPLQQVARMLGISFQAVESHLLARGIGNEVAYRKSRARYDAKRDRAKAAARTKAYEKTERGRRARREADARAYYKKKKEERLKEFAHVSTDN